MPIWTASHTNGSRAFKRMPTLQCDNGAWKTSPWICLSVSLTPATLIACSALLEVTFPAATPPMGWNSWNHFSTGVTDAVVRAQADAMVSTGMRNAGYTYVNIDDTFMGSAGGSADRR